ncbi:excalibur calcium-binding domain-containing protein [Bradyrhizobium tropiciagri]|nr:excalibur calcium-binding domain-containing protein [Bradyrhizobium tropiciagri]
MAALTSPVMAQGTIKVGKDGATANAAPVNAPKPKANVFFRNCTEARAAGYSRIRRGEPGYAPHLDRDNDGIACE